MQSLLLRQGLAGLPVQLAASMQGPRQSEIVFAQSLATSSVLHGVIKLRVHVL
jgi:hypothetical protein